MPQSCTMNAHRSIVDPEGAGWLRNFSARPNSHGQLGQLTITSQRVNSSLTSLPSLIPTLRKAANSWGSILPAAAQPQPQNFKQCLRESVRKSHHNPHHGDAQPPTPESPIPTLPDHHHLQTMPSTIVPQSGTLSAVPDPLRPRRPNLPHANRP